MPHFAPTSIILAIIVLVAPLANAVEIVATADANRDGEINLVEFTTAQNPNATTSAATPLVRDGGLLEFTYSRSVAALSEGVTFTVEWSDTLAPDPWSTAGVTELVVGSNGIVQTVKATLPTGSNSERFVRLRVTRP